MSKVGAVIQARMGSTRLPGKVMKIIEGKTALAHVIERVKLSKLIDDVLIATTIHERDDVIVDEALKCGALVLRGSEEDVLSRYYFSARENGFDPIVRVTSDCPLIDHHITDNLIRQYLAGDSDIVGTAGIGKRTYPTGLDCSVFSFEKLQEAYLKADKQYQREHVTPYIYENGKVTIIENPIDYSRHRWTLDTKEDLELIEAIYSRLYKGKHDFFFKDILHLVVVEEPELSKINVKG